MDFWQKISNYFFLILTFVLAFILQVNFLFLSFPLKNINFLLIALIFLFLYFEKINFLIFLFLSILVGLFLDISAGYLFTYILIFPLSFIPLYVFFVFLERKTIVSKIIGGFIYLFLFFLLDLISEFFLKKIIFFKILTFNFILTFSFFCFLLLILDKIFYKQKKENKQFL